MNKFRHLFLCFQTSVYTLGEFHKNRKNSTVFEELEVFINNITGLLRIKIGYREVSI
jgi:hypothetical protein